MGGQETVAEEGGYSKLIAREEEGYSKLIARGCDGHVLCAGTGVATGVDVAGWSCRRPNVTLFHCLNGVPAVSRMGDSKPKVLGVNFVNILIVNVTLYSLSHTKKI